MREWMGKSWFWGNGLCKFIFVAMHHLQDLEEVLKKLRERLQNQLSQAITLKTTHVVVGEYLSPCICDKTLQIQDNNYFKV